MESLFSSENITMRRSGVLLFSLLIISIAFSNCCEDKDTVPAEQFKLDSYRTLSPVVKPSDIAGPYTVVCQDINFDEAGFKPYHSYNGTGTMTDLDGVLLFEAEVIVTGSPFQEISDDPFKITSLLTLHDRAAAGPFFNADDQVSSLGTLLLKVHPGGDTLSGYTVFYSSVREGLMGMTDIMLVKN